MTLIPDEIPRLASCRVFEYEKADGPTNMARDEAMLELVSEDPSAAVFRIYGWTEPTLSLGYFQSYEQALADPRWRDVPIVRRPTGGGAIFHEHEFTYALAVPRDHPFAKRTSLLYEVVHRSIVSALSYRGFMSAPREEPGKTDSDRPFLCFEDHAANDVVIGVHKVVGSAQRRRRGVVLQHGSILWAHSEMTPELPGIGDLNGIESAVPLPLVKTLNATMMIALSESWSFVPWPESTLRYAEALEHDVYRNDAWTRKR